MNLIEVLAWLYFIGYITLFLIIAKFIISDIMSRELDICGKSLLSLIGISLLLSLYSWYGVIVYLSMHKQINPIIIEVKVNEKHTSNKRKDKRVPRKTR